MRLLIVLMLLAFAPACLASQAERQSVSCFRTDQVTFAELHPRIRFSPDPPKKASIEVSVEVECASGAVIVPRSTDDAVERLEAALPADYKIAISKGASITSYRYGNFAASADLDLLRYFTSLWGLEYGSPACRGVEALSEQDFQCYFSLLQQLRKNYRDMISYVPPDIGEEAD